MRVDGRWTRCECFGALQSAERYRAGGFPAALEGLKAAAAISMSGIPHRSAETLAGLAHSLMSGRYVEKSLLIEGLPGSRPEALVAYLASEIVREREAYCMDVERLVTERFSGPEEGSVSLTAAARSKSVVLFVRLGYDGKHSWLGGTLSRVVVDRCADGAPTVLFTDQPIAMLQSLYGPSAMGILHSRSVKY